MRYLVTMTVAWLVLGQMSAAHAQGFGDGRFQELRNMSPEQRRAYVQNLSEEERAELRSIREQFRGARGNGEGIRGNFRNMSPEERREKWNNLSDEQKAQFKEKRKARWQGMSNQEKVQLIEKRRTERLQKMNSRWNNMSDEEKIRFVEERFNGQGRRGGGFRGRQ